MRIPLRLFVFLLAKMVASIATLPAQSQIFTGGGGGGNGVDLMGASHVAFLKSSAEKMSNINNGHATGNPTSGRSPIEQQQQPVTKLEPPFHFQAHPFVQGPGFDLVALNRRRFELDHQHSARGVTDSEYRQSDMTAANIMAIPERLLSQLPDDVNKQIFESLSADPTLMMGASGGLAAATGAASNLDSSALIQQQLQQANEDPDGASIERLTKSCLTIHASSARPEQLNVTFHLYTKKNPHVPYLIWPHVSRHELLTSSPFDPNKPIKWVTHGFHTNLDKSEWMLETRDKILAHEDANVFLTDWRRGASPALAFYPKAAANAHVVAKMIVKILRRLRNDVDFSRIHLIGHSLGAHIMGFVGSAFTEEYLHFQQQRLSGDQAFNFDLKRDRLKLESMLIGSNMLIGRITACDPALPCFGPTSSGPNSRSAGHSAVVPAAMEQANGSTVLVPVTSRSATGNQNAGNPLTPITAAAAAATSGSMLLGETITDWTPTMWTHMRPDSAIVVEVMHSNPGVMGYAEPLGDYDFYPNGFERQPGCANEHQSTSGSMEENLSPASPKSSSRSLERTKRQASGLMGQLVKSVMPTNRLTSALDRFLKPIMDFVHGYTCSHHRSVEYMVESMYYERVPQDRKLDKDLICQMVGYRCNDYLSFKRGFCFSCQNDLDCRAFLMPISLNLQQKNYSWTRLSRRNQVSLANPYEILLEKFYPKNKTVEINDLDSTNSKTFTRQQHETTTTSKAKNNGNKKRILPTFNPYGQNYKPLQRNSYYFDTKSSKHFCLHHYHLFVKYRWFRVRDSVQVDGLVLSGTLGNLMADPPTTFNRFNHQSYTMLITHTNFLGQIESLVIFGSKLKPILVDYIEVTYMSNLDPRIRALGSAKLCRSQKASGQFGSSTIINDHENNSPVITNPQSLQSTLFVRCLGAQMV